MDDPASIDLVAIAYLRDAIQRIDARYDTASVRVTSAPTAITRRFTRVVFIL